jgi:hypothetical protein
MIMNKSFIEILVDFFFGSDDFDNENVDLEKDIDELPPSGASF